MAIPLRQYLAQVAAQNGQYTQYDPSLASTIGGAQSSLADLVSQYSRGVNSTKIQFGQQSQRLKRTRNENLLGNTDNYASNGLLRSGIFAKAQGDIGSKYTQDLSDLNTSRQNTLTSLRDKKLEGENSIRQSVIAASNESAQRLDQQRREAAQADAEAAHQRAMLDLQRQQLAAQEEAARAAQNAFRSNVGGTGQAFLFGGQQQPSVWDQFSGMSPDALKTLQLMAFFKQIAAQKKNPTTSRTAHYQ